MHFDATAKSLMRIKSTSSLEEVSVLRQGLHCFLGHGEPCPSSGPDHRTSHFNIKYTMLPNIYYIAYRLNTFIVNLIHYLPI